MNLKDISAKLEKAREEERTIIAREIHDELGQQLTAIKMDLSWLAKKTANINSEISGRTKEILKLVEQAVITVRKIATDLRPGILDDLGLIAALEWKCAEFEKRSNIKCSFNSNIEDAELPEDLSTNVYRIFQEALTNIARHSGASTINVRLTVEPNFMILEIKDDGTGITEEEIKNNTTLGILGMKERANIFEGELTITGSEFGTIVRLKMPLPTNNKLY